MSLRQYSVIVADDHAIVKEGLVSLLKEHGFDVVGAVGDGHALMDAARRLRPDLIVTDLSMPGLSGLDVLTRLKTEHIDSKVIVLTMHHDADLATAAMRAGASGFLLKHAAGEELLTAIQQAVEGRVYLTPALTKEVIERMAATPGSVRAAVDIATTGCAAPDRGRTANKGDRRDPPAVRANGRIAQISNDADPRRLLYGRSRQVCAQASTDRGVTGAVRYTAFTSQ